MNTSPLPSKPRHHPTLPTVIKWVVWSLAVTFYFYEYILRVFPSVMVDELMETFLLTAGQAGLVIGSYFYIYAPMQIPVGILLDRFGAKRILPTAAFLCGLATLLFGFAPNAEMIFLARILVGLGSSFAFVGVVYLTVDWFSHKLMAPLIGLTSSISMLGAIAGEGPIGYLQLQFGWRHTVIGLGIIGLAVGILLYLGMRKLPVNHRVHQPSSFKLVFSHLKRIFAHPQSWINALISVFMYATTAAFAALWAVPFLHHTHHISTEEAGYASSMIYVGWIFGGPLLASLSDMIGNRRIVMRFASIVALLALIAVIWIPTLPIIPIFILLTVVGFCSGAQLLTYSVAIELHPRVAAGSSSAFTNFIVMIGGGILQPLVGLILDIGGDGIPQFFGNGDFRLAVTLFPLAFFAAFIITFFLKEKRYVAND